MLKLPASTLAFVVFAALTVATVRELQAALPNCDSRCQEKTFFVQVTPANQGFVACIRMEFPTCFYCNGKTACKEIVGPTLPNCVTGGACLQFVWFMKICSMECDCRETYCESNEWSVEEPMQVMDTYFRCSDKDRGPPR